MERIISNFKVDSTKIFENDLDLYEDYTVDADPDFDDGWDW